MSLSAEELHKAKSLLAEHIAQYPSKEGPIEKHTEEPIPLSPTDIAPPSDFKPLEFDNAFQFHQFFWPEYESYVWQKQTLLQLSGFPEGQINRTDPLRFESENPLIYYLVAANGSGKTEVILARIALWLCATKVRHKTIVTSASFSQLKHITFRAIESAANDINRVLGFTFFKCVECYVTCAVTQSFIRGFATDQPGRAEGFHPSHGAEMAVLVDESKTIEDSMHTAFRRFTGFSLWLEISSPGECAGMFYRNVMAAQSHWPAPLKPGTTYTRTITAFECPHIPKVHIENVKRVEGESSIIYRSSILAEFTSIDVNTVILQESTIYENPTFNSYNLPVCAGLDISLGGDETVLSVWHGNTRIHQLTWRIKESSHLHLVLSHAFRHLNLEAENIFADGGGIGKPIIQRLHEIGWEINSIRNEASARNPKQYLNRGIELWMFFKRLVEEKVLALPREDFIFMNQIVTRRFTTQNGKLKIEPKKDARSRGVPSPDRADAAILAFAGRTISEFQISNAQEPPRQFTVEDYERLIDEKRWRDFEATETKPRANFTAYISDQKSALFQRFIAPQRPRI